MSNVNHIDVTPRMWDKSLSASYIPKPPPDDSKDPVEETVVSPTVVAGATTAVSIMDKLKTYLMPALLLLGIVMVIYILWKYFIIYRNKKNAPATAPTVITEDEITKPGVIDPRHLIQTQDMSKYECNSDMDDDVPQFEEVEEEVEEDEEEAQEPDISEIEQLIKETPGLPMLEEESEEDEDEDESESDEKETGGEEDADDEGDDVFIVPVSKPKRVPRKPARITV